MIKLKEGELFVVECEGVNTPLYEAEGTANQYVIAHNVNMPENKTVFNQDFCVLIRIARVIKVNKRIEQLFRNQI